MKVTKLTPNISVAHQLTEQDLEEAAAAGFKTIINNRPDGEAPDQPPKRGARGHREAPGPRVPSHPSRLGPDFNRSGRGVQDSPRRGGETRPRLLPHRDTLDDAVGAGGQRPPFANEILQTTSEAGYNLEALRPQLEDASEKRSSST